MAPCTRTPAGSLSGVFFVGLCQNLSTTKKKSSRMISFALLDPVQSIRPDIPTNLRRTPPVRPFAVAIGGQGRSVAAGARETRLI